MNFIKIIKKKYIVVLLFIILGVLFLKDLYTYREGSEGRTVSPSEAATSASLAESKTDPPPPNVTPQSTGDLVKDIGEYAKDATAEANVPFEMPDTSVLLQSLTDLVATENARNTERANAMAIAAAEENNIPAENTVAPIIIDNSFFIGDKFSDAFCNKYSGPQLETKCSELTEDNCNITDCCVYVNGTKCMAGSATGPKDTASFNTDTDYYLYKYQCYGKCDVYREEMVKRDKPPILDCRDELNIISTTCFNQYVASLDCSGYNIPYNFSGESEAGFIIANNELDISIYKGATWGDLKKGIAAGIKSKPADCSNPNFITQQFNKKN